jgi:predicted nucleic acid-binding protein
VRTCYLDTSFLIKLYVFEHGSKEAASQLNSENAVWVINWLTPVEVVSTLRRKAQDDALTLSEAAVAIAKFRGHTDIGLYSCKPLPEAIFKVAENLVDQHGGSIRLRSLDLLHVATALYYGVDGFATYDTSLKLLAKRVGLELLNP